MDAQSTVDENMLHCLSTKASMLTITGSTVEARSFNGSRRSVNYRHYRLVATMITASSRHH
ncbi:uncharacterized protein N7483_002578 [Penicillium malachiteum]|uniref:uncharacterized protein n=1 Tax=Penicillium malachiteum TaxID=1324776 RepID=UPI002546E4C9|nr:uncharacterized protein N7483_002578 [Penicillium malachiteum]KAJ5737453.1 hypothetical protein N7483_002578 [Penicillium malachiteum]